MMLKSEKGQGTVELAITFTVLVILVFGIVDFGYAFYSKLTMEHSSREGARAGSLGSDDADIKSVVEDSLVGLLPEGSNIDEYVTIQYVNSDGDVYDETEDTVKYVEVIIDYDYKYFTPLLALIGSALDEDTLSLNSSTQMRVE
ncbi:TadE/TadG family type IV pilus assembly protein [Aquisalibacillus elongatus]|uniref:TadE-like protein n=1 Tax=Aquisalibacillus elongatus TaxID=485577 RepID=A0A3N5BDT4_9BACI|nr:TadE family protein [Aquisalibacillus elongatus]RPF55846.1 TadE-like protein [Aquisalibacillus elongatus]